MPLLIESLLTLLLFYVIGVGFGWLLWGRSSRA
jgi:hypothetical protein